MTITCPLLRAVLPPVKGNWLSDNIRPEFSPMDKVLIPIRQLLVTSSIEVPLLLDGAILFYAGHCCGLWTIQLRRTLLIPFLPFLLVLDGW